MWMRAGGESANARAREKESDESFVSLVIHSFVCRSSSSSSASSPRASFFNPDLSTSNPPPKIHNQTQNNKTADTANTRQLKKIYHNSSLALAGLVPLAVFQQQGDLFGRVVDAGLNVALPVHSHIAMNYVVTDYVPKSIRGAARWGVLGSSAVIAAGMLRLNVAGPGVTATVKALWKGGEAGFASKEKK